MYSALIAMEVSEPRSPSYLSLELMLGIRIYQDQQRRFYFLIPAMTHVFAESVHVMMEIF
jgi:hypothetical protein